MAQTVDEPKKIRKKYFRDLLFSKKECEKHLRNKSNSEKTKRFSDKAKKADNDNDNGNDNGNGNDNDNGNGNDNDNGNGNGNGNVNMRIPSSRPHPRSAPCSAKSRN